jgi:hypothetical protein
MQNAIQTVTPSVVETKKVKKATLKAVEAIPMDMNESKRTPAQNAGVYKSKLTLGPKKVSEGNNPVLDHIFELMLKIIDNEENSVVILAFFMTHDKILARCQEIWSIMLDMKNEDGQYTFSSSTIVELRKMLCRVNKTWNQTLGQQKMEICLVLRAERMWLNQWFYRQRRANTKKPVKDLGRCTNAIKLSRIDRVRRRYAAIVYDRSY